MSFLDHFRRKSPQPEQPVTTTAGARGEIATKIGDLRSTPDFKSPPAEPEEEKQQAAPAPLKSEAEEASIHFSLGDILHRIPRQLLKPGPHEPRFELSFDAADVSERIAHGKTTISLAEVYQRAPHIFRGELRDADNINIRFPWQKVMHLVQPKKATDRKEECTEAAADSSAAQMRNRTPDAVTSGSSRVKSRSTGTQPPWFSRPTQPAVKVGASSPTTTPQSAPQQPPPSGERNVDLAALPIDPASLPGPESVPEPIPPATRSSATSSESTERGPEPQLALPLVGEPQASADTIRGGTDVALDVGRKQRAHPRDELSAETEKARVQSDQKTNQANLQASLTRSMEAVAQSDGIRAALQATIDAQATEQEKLKKEIEELKKAGDEKLEGIVRERDAVLQQKNHLSDQLAQMRHGRGPASGESAEGASGGGQVERSKREYQRQIEELQRRIAAFENNQKEAAHELGKEREARIKVERALAAAERTRAEATALVENTRNETRRELETTLRKREAEFARAQQEMQEQIESLTQAKHDATTGREQLLARAEEEANKSRAEREQLHARIAELDHAASAAAAGARQPASTDWESRAVASLEADVENYRNRIKALLQERESWSKEREKLLADSTQPSRRVSLPGPSETALRQLTAANDKLSADLAAATSERDRLVEQIRATEQRLRREEHVQSRLDALIKAREQADGELTRIKALLVQMEADHRLHLAGLQEKHDALAREKSDAARQFEEIKLLQESEVQRVAQLLPQIETLTAERDTAMRERGKLLAENSLLKAKGHGEEDEPDRSPLGQQREMPAAQSREEQRAFSRSRMELEQRLAAALHENRALTSRVESFARSARQPSESPHKPDDDAAPRGDICERDVIAVKTEHVRALAAACAERDEARARIIELETKISTETAALTRERDETRQERAALAQRIAALEAGTERMMTDSRRQCDVLAGERRAALAELEIAQEAQKTQREAFARERDAAIRQRDEALAAAAQRTHVDARENTFALHRECDLQQLEAEVSGRFEYETARLRRERDTLLRQRDELRERVSRMVADQRDLVEEPSHHTLKPMDATATAREPEENNIIDITADAVLTETETEANIDLPRVRPVAIPPPQIRVL